MNVLIVSQPTSGGVAQCVRQLTEAAVATGHDVTVACPSASEGPLADWVTAAGATHVPVKLTREPELGDLRTLIVLRKLIRNRDLVHLHSSKAGALGRMAVASTLRRRPKVVFTPHAWSWLVGGRMAALYRGIERILAPLADRIVAVSVAEAEVGRPVLGPAASRTVVIENGIDRTRYHPDGPRAERDLTAPLLVCVGRLSEQKGQDIAIRALSQLDIPGVRLRLVGSGPERSALEDLAAELGVAERVEWVAHQDEPVLEYRAADVVVAPSRWDGMSLVLLEAMASGCAIVASDVLGVEALNGAGIVVGKDDVVAFRNALNTMLADPDLRAGYGEQARQRSADYDLGHTLARNLALWSDLCS